MAVLPSILTLTESLTSSYSRRMRNWNLHILLFALCVLVSCTKESTLEPEVMTVEYIAAVNECQVKSLGDGSEVNHIWYAVYNADGSLFYECDGPAELIGGKAYCPVKMVLGKQYRVVFLAMHYDDAHISAYEIDSASALVNYPSRLQANTDKGDMFYTYEDVAVYSGMVAKGVVLERVVSQVNILCSASDWNAAQTKPGSSALELFGVPVSFSLFDGKASQTEGNVSYPRTGLPEGTDLNMNGDYVVFSAYAFAPAAPQVSEASAEFKMWDEGSSGSADYVISIPRMQLQSNMKTNVKGNLITEGNI